MPSLGMANVLDEDKKQQVIALGCLGWSRPCPPARLRSFLPIIMNSLWSNGLQGFGVRSRRRGIALLFICALRFTAPTRVHAQTVMDTRAETFPAGPHPKGWWPRQSAPARDAYTGPQTCATCHRLEYNWWKRSQMAHAMKPAAKSRFLHAHPQLVLNRGPYTYRISLSGGRAIYSVTDGEKTLSVPLLWAYGTGVVTRSFVFHLNRTYSDAEVAYYPSLGRLGVEAGLNRAPPPSLEQAFGFRLSPEAARQCIACHTTAAVTGGRLHVGSMIPGVSCEACHGPGARHAAAMRALTQGAIPKQAYILNPAKLAPSELEDFCGACHRSTRLVIGEGIHGLDTVHYEPYRLEMSQCWIMSQQITCITCHDPHRPLELNAEAYIRACLRCHSRTASGTMAGRICPMATRHCVTCHMPKCRLPLAPISMYDHFIRVVRPDDPCFARH